MTRILFVRHGQSEWNAVGRWQGQADPPLSDLGRRQARMAADRIGAVDVIVASDLERASHTAVIISETLGVGPVVIDARLRERRAGPWEGLTRSEIDAGWPGHLDADRRPDGWESDVDLLSRTREALDAIAIEYAGADVLVVSHGGLVYAMERSEQLPHQRLPNLAGRWLTHHGDRVEIHERVVLVDDDHITTVPAQI